MSQDAAPAGREGSVTCRLFLGRGDFRFYAKPESPVYLLDVHDELWALGVSDEEASAFCEAAGKPVPTVPVDAPRAPHEYVTVMIPKARFGPPEKVSVSRVEAVLAQVADEGTYTCPCGETIEPDAPQCGACGRKNPLVEHALI